MSPQERSNFISLITTLGVSVPYFVYILGRYSEVAEGERLSFLASALLLLIPLRIVAEIVIHIVVAIYAAAINQKEEKDLSDERDQLIGLKSIRNSYYAFCFGILVAMLVMVSNGSSPAMLAIMIGAGFVSELVDIVSKIYYYRRGA